MFHYARSELCAVVKLFLQNRIKLLRTIGKIFYALCYVMQEKFDLCFNCFTRFEFWLDVVSKHFLYVNCFIIIRSEVICGWRVEIAIICT